MQCSQCGQQNTVTVDGKTYCGNCGYQKTTHVLNLDQDEPDSADQKPAGGNVLDLSELPDKPVPTVTQAQPQVTEPPKGVASHQLHSRTDQPAKPEVTDSEPSQATEIEEPEQTEETDPAHERLERAGKIEKSQHVSKFGSLHQAESEVQDTEEAEEPEIPPEPTQVPPQPKTNVGDEIARRHVRAPQSSASQQTADLSHLASSSAPDSETTQPVEESSGPPLPIEEAETPSKLSLLKNLFRRPHLSSATAAVISILLLAGYVTYLNFPNIALRVAASKAGFSARMPRYMPDQFDFSGPVAYGPGQIVVNFSGEEGQNVAITQRETDLDSVSLLENHIEAESTKPPLTFHERGLTIYVFNGNKASWVNRGIWYTIEGDHNLNAEQVIRIATSL